MRPIDGVLRSLGAVGLFVGLTFACGNDTKTDPDEDDGGTGGSVSAAGGNGGTGGSATSGSGGSAGPTTSNGTTSGSGGTDGVNTTASAVTSNTTSSTTGAAGAGEVPEPMPGLAEPCDADDDCETDLICLAAESNSLIVGGPSNGLCTAPCSEDTPCGAEAACILFGETGYCMPMCVPGNGVQDCAGRTDTVCDILPVGVSCSSNAECGGGTACLDATECVLPVCLPKCNADSDCPEGRFCDPRYGECVDEAPEGSGLDELCDAEAEEDECLGFCAGGGETDARCMQTCVLGAYPTCGSESADNATAECLLPYVGADDGDLGFCVGLCDCSSDCVDDGLVCVSFESIDFDPPEVRGRAGFCAPMSEEILEDQILACEE